MVTTRNGTDRDAAEISILERFGLRWAILSAWWDELRVERAPAVIDLSRRLEAARVKIASGCFTSCEVGCDLDQVEAVLVSVDGSRSPNRVSYWLDLLGQAMAGNARSSESLSALPAVKVHYRFCGLKPCRCDSLGR